MITCHRTELVLVVQLMRRGQSEPSSNNRKKYSRSLSSIRKSVEKRGRSSGRSPSRTSVRLQGDLAKVAFTSKFTSSRFVANSLFLTFVGFSLGTVGYFCRQMLK